MIPRTPSPVAPARRSTGRRARPALLAAGLTLVLAGSLSACLPKPQPPTATPAPTTSAAPGTVPTDPGTTTPGDPGTPVPTAPGTTVAPTPTTPTPSTPTPSTPSVTIPQRALHADMKGTGTAAFGDDAEAAIYALSRAFGKQPDRRTALPGNPCGIKAKLDVSWGDVTVTMLDKGDGLKVAGYHWGDLATRNASGEHPRPSGAEPTLWNNWGLFIGRDVPPDAAHLLARLAPDLDEVALISAPGIADPAIVGSANGHRLNIGLHQVPGGYQIERLWVFDPAEVLC